ncbi:enoyl-CoA hydratase [Pseudogemmobacter humi]|uniref:2,3-dehydroadipyl-CoA hydratase n=1 Tax=Pseudogemmobacter humi TaxID=2483812 RepID=A0A3P5X1N8_9RHOB|nr:enoyl-CoA hydratase [Pseudogemmobacter humi]VDC28032.1 2,3-dehydroadipyl-CoA hydratase [Pseudogemmobacter humi]
MTEENTPPMTEAMLAAGEKLAGGEILRLRTGRVEWLAFNRPAALNAMTHAMETAMIAVFRELETDRDLRGLVLTGMPGARPSFMAGGDMADLGAVATPRDVLATEASAEEVTTRLEALRVPTIAAMAGPCIGMGALIAAACDVRIATPSLRFGFPIARTVGNCLSARNFARLTALIGPARTKEMVFSARLLPAGALAEAGALREVTDDEASLLPRARMIAEEMAALAPLTLWGTKEILRRMRDTAIAAVEDEDVLMACYGSEDYHTAITAFTTRQKPVFKGS